MPIGAFLDSFPPALFITVHIIFLLVGVWAARKVSAFWLYVVVHLGFLAYFGGILTLKMSVLIEQVLIFIMVVMIASKARKS